MWKEAVMKKLKLPGETEENHKNPQLGYLVSGMRSEPGTS
jgi:hypothetical protein